MASWLKSANGKHLPHFHTNVEVNFKSLQLKDKTEKPSVNYQVLQVGKLGITWLGDFTFLPMLFMLLVCVPLSREPLQNVVIFT